MPSMQDTDCILAMNYYRFSLNLTKAYLEYHLNNFQHISSFSITFISYFSSTSCPRTFQRIDGPGDEHFLQQIGLKDASLDPHSLHYILKNLFESGQVLMMRKPLTSTYIFYSTFISITQRIDLTELGFISYLKVDFF